MIRAITRYQALMPLRTLALLMLAVPLLSSQQPPAYSLTVEVQGIRNVQGLMNIGLFSDAASFPERSKAKDGVLLRVSSGKVSHSFRNLPAGTYCVAVFHDRNSNGAIDKNFFGIPTEGFGFSNDAIGTFGPPSFSEASVTLRSDKTIIINLRHY